jgi:hypothetical protein
MALKVFEKQQLNNAHSTELGRIRLGQKVTKTGRNGAYTAPEKLREFRFTSHHKHLIEALAAKHGGEVIECDPTSQLKGQWEVLTDASQLNAIVLTSNDASQWMEFYNQKDGCIRRCNQLRMVNPADINTRSKMPSDPDEQEEMSAWESPCLCERLRAEAAAGGPAFDEQKFGCKAVTRLSVFLPDIPGLGTWRLETKGEYAKSGIPGSINFIKQFLPPDVAWIPVTITLELHKEKVTQADGKVIDAEFVVPVITTPFSMGDMVSGQLGARIAEFGRSLGSSPLSSLGTSAPALTQSASAYGEDMPAEVVEAHVVDDEPAAAEVVSEEPMTPVKAYGILGVTESNVGDLKAALKQTGVDVNFGDFAKVRAESGDKSPEEFMQAIKLLNPGAFEVVAVAAEPVAEEPDPFATPAEQESLGGLN